MKIIVAHVHYAHWDRLSTRGAEEGFLEEMAEVCERVGIVKIGLLANPGRGNDLSAVRRVGWKRNRAACGVVMKGAVAKAAAGTAVPGC